MNHLLRIATIDQDAFMVYPFSIEFVCIAKLFFHHTEPNDIYTISRHSGDTINPL